MRQAAIWTRAGAAGHEFSCSGALVHPVWVLTSARCVADAEPADLKVTVGDWNLDETQPVSLPPVAVDVTRVRVSPGDRATATTSQLQSSQTAEAVNLYRLRGHFLLSTYLGFSSTFLNATVLVIRTRPRTETSVDHSFTDESVAAPAERADGRPLLWLMVGPCCG